MTNKNSVLKCWVRCDTIFFVMGANMKNTKRFYIKSASGKMTKVLIEEELLTNKNYEAIKAISKNYTQNKGGFLLDGIDTVKKRATHLVAAKDYSTKAIMGYCVFEEGCYCKEEGAKDLHILQIAVDPKFKHNGIANEMVGFLEETSAGFGFVSAEVNNFNIPSQKLFIARDYKSKQLKNHDQTLFAKNVARIIEKPKKLDIKPSRFETNDDARYTPISDRKKPF